MDIYQLTTFLGWCAVVNYFILMFWFFTFVVTKDALFRVHSGWFHISTEQFNYLHYWGISFFKILVFVFNLVPYIALRIMQ